ncbi:MAG TPA: hypothetical protein VMH82_03915 [Myxococcota bacterium]|nr:hypothetical protein [Myxococcota bacterium]
MRPATSTPLLLALALGCATGSHGGASAGKHYDFFAAPVANNDDVDPWYPKVVEWQGRAQKDKPEPLLVTHRSLANAENTGWLRLEMGAWREEERRALAKRILDWTQHQARKHYKLDLTNDPVFDHWPTVGELLVDNGGDCDAVDLIAYQLMREFGFPADHLYRAIVRRDRDRANHMVTLWFETGDDPWVLDATGAMTFSMRHFSELPGWTPTKVFNEDKQFLAVERSAPPREPAVAGH